MCLSLSSFLALLVCLVAVGLSSPAQAQTRDKYLISATAGGINFVSGNVTVVRQGATRQQSLMDQDNLESGDVVTTGMGGRVEVLLNPGSYMRVAENSEFEMSDTSLDHLRIKLLRGSAIIEVVGTDDTQLSLQVDTPQTYAVIVKRGIYRINVLQTGATEILVRKGRALVGATAEVVKGDKMIVISGGSTTGVAKIDKRAKDSLELWSRDRAEYLASVNRRLPTSTVYAAMNIFNAEWSSSSYNNNGTSRFSGGVWVRDGNCFVFLPVTGRGWASPYGFAYPFGYRYCCSNNDYRNPGNNTPPTTGGGNGGSTGTGAGNNPPSNTDPPERQPSNPGNDGPVSQPRPEPATYTPSAPSYSPPPSQPAPVRESAPARMESPTPATTRDSVNPN
jgi:hypothetical protein